MKKRWALIVVSLIAVFLVFYQFTFIPKYLAFDEVEFTKLALSLDGKPYSPYSQLATGHSTMYFYILLTSIKTFGINVFALRFPAAVFGILSIILFYLIIKEFKHFELLIKKYNILPFLLTLILLTSRWFINFSRFSFEPTFLLFLELTSIYFLLRAMIPKAVSSFNLIISGIFAGLAFNSYTPGRIFFLLPLGFLVFKLVNSLTRKLNNKIVEYLLYFLISFIIIIIPLTSYFLTHQDSRIDQLFFWRNHEMTIQQKVSGTLQNISSLSFMFFYKGDMNGRHNYPGKPALNPILAGLFLIGLFISLKNYRKDFNIFFIAYFLISVAPSIPIYPWENPSMLRTFTMIPSLVYFIGIAVVNLSKKIKPRFYFLIFLVIFLSSFYELRTYFKYQSKVFESSFEIKHPLEKAIKMKNVYEKVNQ
jgi:4-amino-4-deoxy-L-arabinose transferase-like glycosyltransferase